MAAAAPRDTAFLTYYCMCTFLTSLHQAHLSYLTSRMNKPEIKDYLESIYGIEVHGVRTQIVLGMLPLQRCSVHGRVVAQCWLCHRGESMAAFPFIQPSV